MVRSALSFLIALARLSGYAIAAEELAVSSNLAVQSVPAARDAGARPRSDEGRNPRVLFITAKDCPRCGVELARLRQAGGEFEKLHARGWQIGPGPENHLQIVDASAIGSLVERLQVREYPTVAGIGDGEILRLFKSGCTTPLDAWTFGFLLKGIDERPPGQVPDAARVETTGHYALRGNHWSVDDDWNPTREKVISHLRGPNHAAHILSTWKIETWSYEELRSVHDDLHERYGGGVSYAAQSQSVANQFSAGRKIGGK